MYDLNIYLNGERGSRIPCICDCCGVHFELGRKDLYKPFKSNRTTISCSHVCEGKLRQDRVNVICTHCGKDFKSFNSLNKSANRFCSRSCAATYNNTHKTKGTRRSKLEKWLEEQLKITYPDLNILYSDKTTISSELDIYIPSLRLAFELNGIFHYEPIFGETKLNQIQNNDNRKFQACLERGIELCIIDTSGHKYVKPSTSQKYLDIILNIIDFKSRLSP